jgi:hypothetical protein
VAFATMPTTRATGDAHPAHALARSHRAAPLAGESLVSVGRRPILPPNHRPTNSTLAQMPVHKPVHELGQSVAVPVSDDRVRVCVTAPSRSVGVPHCSTDQEVAGSSPAERALC